MKVADISDRAALEACGPWGGATLGRPLATLAERFPVKVALRKLEQLEDRRLIDYGVSIAFAWRTPEGEKALEDA